MPSSSEIRDQFVEFFCKKHAHAHVPSSPVVPLNDATLLFANAGMNQFKPYFLGTERPPFPRAANSQKCIRAGGKHNDLDDVGKDTYHHTFFEMLGNWSFGDYFKREAIAWAWELLTDVWKLDATRLHVTVFEGDPDNGIPRDDEAAGFWRAAGVPDARIHLGNAKDNFWEMGATGPCGPCTEIHYDHTPDRTGGPLVNGGTDKVIEIWNLVFIQFNRNEDRSLTPLPARHVDTGMGFERITKVIQGKSSNYDTDVFAPIMDAFGAMTGKRYGGRLDDIADTGFRVVADHLRMAAFAIADGARPGNKKRDAVLRSVIRRAVRFGYQYFGLREPFVNRLVPVVVRQMGGAFPELKAAEATVVTVLKAEEAEFFKTIERGLKHFHAAADSAVALASSDGAADTGEISGYDAAALHTTYGFPVDLTKQMAAELGMGIDEDEYEEAIAEHRKVSSQGREKLVVSAIRGHLPPTDDSFKYGDDSLEATVVGWVADNAVEAAGTLSAGERAAVLLDRTNFYAEQGGQVGDEGLLRTESGAEFRVEDTQRLGETVLHVGVLLDGELAVGERVSLVRSASLRTDVTRNHTATHLLNLALKQVLGGHVEQRGSLVDGEKTRFDFAHDKPVTPDEVRRIEDLVNGGIVLDRAVTALEMPLAEAKALPGVRAVFGEKYPDPVRVVMVGAESPAGVTADLSTEFCGGTHVPRTGTIGTFRIASQEGVAKGVRRITAVAGRAALTDLQRRSAVLDDLTGRLRCKPEDLAARIEALQDQVKKLQVQAKKGATADVAGQVDQFVDDAETVNGGRLVVGLLPAVPVEALRAQIDRVKQKLGSAIAVFGTADEEGKVTILAGVTADLVKRGAKAGDIVKAVAAVVGGSGGGRPDMAQAGGKDPTKLAEALEKARELGKELLAK